MRYGKIRENIEEFWRNVESWDCRVAKCGEIDIV